jgi:hypothetical protein
MAADVDANFGPLRELTDHAAHLNGSDRPNLLSQPVYELMSGALVWRDETRHARSCGLGSSFHLGVLDLANAKRAA